MRTIETIKICGGVTLHHSRETKFKCGIMTVRFLAPLDNMTASDITLLFRVLARGTHSHPSAASIRKECDTLWGATLYPTSAALGEIQNIGFTASFINDRYLPEGESAFDGVCRLLGEMLHDPLTDEGGRLSRAFVESERDNLIADLKNEDDKEELCRFKMESLMFEGERFNICADGDEKYAAAIDSERLTDFYYDFIESAPVEICIFADIDLSRAAEAMTWLFARGRRRRADRDFPIADVIRRAPRPPRVEKETRRLSQTRICAGYRTGTVIGDDDYLAFELMCELLGRCPTNKLHTLLRERDGLCYSCFLSTEVYKGLLRIECGCERKKVEKAIEMMSRTITSVAVGDFSLTEFESAKKSLISSLRSIGDDPLSIASFYYRRYLVGVETTIEDEIYAVERLTKDEAANAAALLDPDVTFVLEEKV